MKTTIEMNDDLFRRAKQVAAAEGVTLRELIERGLRAELARREVAEYTLQNATFNGDGVVAGVTEGDWRTIAARRRYPPDGCVAGIPIGAHRERRPGLLGRPASGAG